MRSVLLVVALAVVPGPSLGGTGAEPAAEKVEAQDPIDAVDRDLELYWTLSDSLEALAAGAGADASDEAGVDEIVLLEVDEMAEVAGEFFLEGDPGTAADLLVAAIRLLDPGRRE